VPIEISPRGRTAGDKVRLFRLGRGIAVDHVDLDAGLPEEPAWLLGPLELRFHLPGDPQPIACEARAVEVVVDADTEAERAERRALSFVALPSEVALRIERYVEERLTQR